MKNLLSLNKYLFKYKKHLLAGILFVTVSNIFMVLPAPIIRDAIDFIRSEIVHDALLAKQGREIKYDEFYSHILRFGGLVLGMALCRGLFLYLTRQTIIAMSRHIEYDMKNEIYKQYQALSISFYKRNKTGDLMARISEDVSKVRMYIGPAIMYGVNLLTLFALVISIMFSVNSTMALYTLLPLPFLSIGVYYVSSKMNIQSDRIQRKLSDLSSFVQEAFSGIRVIKAFVREDDSVKKFSAESDLYKTESLKLSMINALFFPLIMGLIGLSTIVTVYVGGMQSLDGSISIGNIAEFILYVNMLTWPVTSVGWITSLVQRAAASQSRINEFMDLNSEIVSEKNIVQNIKGSLTFEKVSLRYQDTGVLALNEVSFSLDAGKTLGIVGTTGSGKSSLATLISRMYDPTTGQVSVDGVPLQDFNLSSLRAQVSVVPQDSFLFSDTIANNIAFGKADASQVEIESAAKSANVYENIMGFKDQFNTVVGERGVTLSGGQKQRVTIARALLGNPSILLFDDCLSAVDTATEDKILSELKTIMTGRTSIIIAHRISTVKSADKIIVLNNGKIVEEGTHDELIKLKGEYQEMYMHQLEDGV